MSELSHSGAYRLIHQSHLSGAEKAALQSHLRDCAACREHAAMAGVMSHHFVLEAASKRPSARFAADYLEEVDRQSRRSRILEPLSTAAGLAVMALVVIAAWYIIQNNPLMSAPGVREQELFDAVLAGESVEVERLLSGLTNPNIRDEEGNALLPVAATTGELEVVRLLLESGADVNSTMKPGGAGKTALMEAAARNQGEMVNLLIAAGADVNQQESASGLSALSFAARLSENQIIKILLAHGADPNVADENGSTPLHIAAGYGYAQTVALLRAGGADLDRPDQNGLTPIMAAIIGGNMYPARSIVLGLLIAGADPNRQDNNGNSALHHAALKDMVDNIPQLIKYGADVGLQNNDGQTPLDLARYGLTREKLLAASAGPMVKGTVPLDKQLFEAVAAGDTAEAGRLLDAGADPNAVDDEDENAVLYLATNSGDSAMVELLLEHGADVNRALSAGYTALEVAGLNEDIDLIRILLEHGADPNQRNMLWNNGTALHSVVNYGRFRAAQMLLDAGADVNMVTDNDMTPLISMIRIGRFGLNEVLPIAELLLDAGVDPDHQDTQGRTALHYAEDGELITLLIERGADVNVQDDEGQTALHRAVSRKNSDVVAVLLENGAEADLQDHQGRTPLDLAAPGRIEEMLRQAMDKE
jgi:ankyrin repeat protein